MPSMRRPEPWVFLILFASYAFFWHSRDWNSGSRLMLTYALVDRGTVFIDGLDQQTNDKAFFRGRFYSDKLPGYSLLAAVPYELTRTVLRLPPHPLNLKAFAYWPADYWVTLGTSGLLSALTGVLLVGLARDLGCDPRRSALVALAYGLATPAYAYATLSYGHQASAFALLASFALLWRSGRVRPGRRAFWAGLLAAYAAVIELQVGPVAAILGLYLVVQVVGGRRPFANIADFAVGAALPTLLLLGYNQLAFGSPWDMGYFHHAMAIFARVHTTQNPLGLRPPDWSKAPLLLWGEYRGLVFYAPILVLALPGWVVLVARRTWGMALVSASVVAAVILVNLSYPEWTGGWSTGPRLLVPLLPFAMLPVAALLAVGGRPATWLALVLALAGGVLMLLFQGAGARIPHFIASPLREAVWPLWRGEPLPEWVFTRNVVSALWPRAIKSLPESRRWVQFLPLLAVQALLIVMLVRCCRAGSAPLRRASRS
jgi:hypothetical protein